MHFEKNQKKMNENCWNSLFYLMHGNIIGMFLYDQIIRNTFRFFNTFNWIFLIGISLGIFVIASSLFSIRTVYLIHEQKMKKCFYLIIFVFVLKLGAGIAGLIRSVNSYYFANKHIEEDITIFIVQSVIVFICVFITAKLTFKHKK